MLCAQSAAFYDFFNYKQTYLSISLCLTPFWYDI